MKDGKIEPIPNVSDDAFQNGFLNKDFCNTIINRMNRQWLVIVPVGYPAASFIQSDENVVLDLSQFLPGTLIITVVANGGPTDVVFNAKLR